MRLFEILILCLMAAGLAMAGIFPARAQTANIGRSRRLRVLFCILLGTALAAHLAWEGAHWQMIPAYLGLALTATLLLLPGMGPAWRIVVPGFVVLLAGMTCGLAFVFPVFEIPAPTGPFVIGTDIESMMDTSRREDAEPRIPRAREVIVQVWYPALPSHNPRAPYRRRSETSLAASYQSVDRTDARYDAPMANVDGGFPILLYNPGWNGRRTQNTALTEDLASHGYVVVAIDHPYNSGPAELADGRVVQPAPTPQFFDEVSSATAIYALIDNEVEKETADTLFVLGRVEAMNEDPSSLFYHRLDPARIGALGYSLGGAVAAEAAYRNPKIHAVLDLDTPLYGEAGKHGISQPFLLLCEDLTNSTPQELARMTFGQRRNVQMDEGDYARQLPLLRTPGSYQIALHGTLHTSFQDVILTSPLQRFSGAGAIPPQRMIQILRQYTVAFFDQSLRGVQSPLLAAQPSPFPEATVLFSSTANGSPRPSP